MASKNIAEIKYLQFLIGNINISLSKVGDILSPASIKSGVPDQLGKLSARIQTLLGTASKRPGDSSTPQRSETAVCHQNDGTNFNKAPSSESAIPQVDPPSTEPRSDRQSETVPSREAASSDEGRIRDYLSKLRDLSMTTDELTNIVLALVELSDTSDIVEHDDEDTYECSACNTTMSDTVCLMEHIHSVEHKKKQKTNRKGDEAKQSGGREAPEAKDEAINNAIVLPEQCVERVGSNEYYCAVCRTELRGSPVMVIRHILDESHRCEHICQQSINSVTLDFQSLSLSDTQDANKLSRRAPSVSRKNGRAQLVPEFPCEPPTMERKGLPMAVLRDHKVSLARKLNNVWQLLEEVLFVERDILYEATDEEFWCKVCGIVLETPCIVVPHVKGRSHQSKRAANRNMPGSTFKSGAVTKKIESS